MTLEEVKNRIVKLEDKYSVDEWEINGVKVWPLLRIELFIRLTDKALGSEGVKTKSVSYIFFLFKSLFKWIWAISWDAKKNAKIMKSDVLFISDGVSFENMGKFWYDKFCDPWIEYYKNNKVSTLLLTLENRYYAPRYSSSLFIQFKLNMHVIAQIVKSKIFKPTIRNMRLEGFDKFISDEILLDRGIHISQEWLYKKMDKVEMYKLFFKKMLNVVRPKLVFIVSYYYDGTMALISLCKEMGIKTVDIQHGVQNEYHLAYGSWSKVPADGYDLLPDFFNVWSPSEYTNISNWSKAIKMHEPVISKNIFLQKWKDPNDKTILYFDEIIKKKINGEKKTILYSKSPQTDSGKVRGNLYDVIAQSQMDYNWLIRLHPSMREQKKSVIKELNEHGIYNFEIDFCTDFPLFSILRFTDLHITEQSSVVIEAAEFNIFSIVTSHYGNATYKIQIQEGKAKFVSSIDEILDTIKIKLSERRERNEQIEKIDFSIYNNLIK
ncbi:MAG: hypothetical protein KA797_01590 [Chitinophagales bacterium]|nr:hypothetical protein [Chitinophagales bacterium]